MPTSTRGPVGGRSYAGLTAPERDAQRRRRLLEAALESMGTAGYAATTVSAVCHRASVSTRHFYDLHTGKEDLFVELYDALTRASYARIGDSLAATAGRPLAERVAQALLAHVEAMLADPRVARLAFVEVVGLSPRVEALRTGHRETLVAMVAAEGAAAVRRGEAADRDWRFATLALVGAVTTVVHDWAVAERRPPRTVVEDQLARLAVTLLAG